MFKHTSVKKKGKKDSLKSLHGRDSNTSLSLPSEPSLTELPDFQDLPAGKKKLSWLGGGEYLNFGIFSGQSVLSGTNVYFKNGGTSDVYEYNHSNKKWTRLPPLPHVGFALAVIDGGVSAVGGFTPSDHLDTDKILTFSTSEQSWKEIHPPLPTPRHYATAVTSGNTLVVAGGSIRNNQRVATVEILDIAKKAWSRGIDLPLPISSPVSVLCGEDFYVLGGFSPQGKQSTVAVCCSVRDLIRSSTSVGEKKNTVETTRETYTLGFPWREIPDAPLTHTTCSSLNGSLVLVGGMKHSKKASGEVFRYDAMEYSWELIGVMPTPRYCSVAVVVPSSRELLVVGGLNGPTGCDYVNLLEVATY